MEVLESGDRYAIYKTSLYGVLQGLPDESLDAVLIRDRAAPSLAFQAFRTLRPGGLAFAIGPGWAEFMRLYKLEVFSDQKVCLAGKNAKRFLFHAITCTEDRCDDCSIQYLSELTPYQMAFELIPYVATGGTVVASWELIEPVVRHHRYALSAREP